MKTSTLGIVLLLAVGIAASCGGPQRSWEERQNKKNDITALFSQIGGWRAEAGMPVAPHPDSVHQMRKTPVEQVKAVCPSAAPVNEGCADVCTLADHICDNADSICDIAAELNGDAWADDKCASAKASCREAKKKCCAKCSQAKAKAAEAKTIW